MDDAVFLLVAILAGFAVGIPVFSILLAAVGGWRALAEFYASVAAFSGRRFWFRSAQFGQASYGACLIFGANHEGIHLSAIPPFRIAHRPLFVPWDEVSCSEYHSILIPLSELRFSKVPQVSILISRRLANSLLESRPHGMASEISNSTPAQPSRPSIRMPYIVWMFAAAAIAVGAILGLSVVRKPTGGDHRPLISFGGKLNIRKSSGESSNAESFYERARAVPSDFRPLNYTVAGGDRIDFSVAGHSIDVAVGSAAMDSAVIRVLYRGEEREVPLKIGNESTVRFEGDAVAISFNLIATTIPPVRTGDPAINGPASVRKLDPNGVVSRYSGERVFEKHPLTDKQAEILRILLTTDQYLMLTGADCFEPGMEIEVGEGNDAIAAVVCLECWTVRVVRGGANPIDRFYGLNKSGLKDLGALYSDVFR